MKKKYLLISAILPLAALNVGALPITFDDQGFVNLQACDNQYVGQGVTFEGILSSGAKVSIDVADSSTFSDVNPPSKPYALSDFYNNDQYSRALTMQINFLSTASGISFLYNPAGSLGVNTLFEFYSAGGVLLDSFSDPAASSDDGTFYLEQSSATGVGYVDIIAPAEGWGHYIDNLNFTPGSSVPDAASTGWLLSSGLAALLAIRRKLV